MKNFFLDEEMRIQEDDIEQTMKWQSPHLKQLTLSWSKICKQ